MNLQQQIKKILREETSKLLSVRRRVSFTEDDVKHYLKKFSLRFLDDFLESGEISDKVYNFTSYELIESGILHMSDEDADKVVNEFSKVLKGTYNDFVKNYIEDILNSNDDETYCFVKHSDRHRNIQFNRGFSECVKGWVNFMTKFGSWFPDLDWNAEKQRISSYPNTYVLIKKPLENHPYEYYFSVLKKT